MNVALVEPIVVNVPYRHREVSSIVARDGVTDILVRITTDDGLVGWGEATSGADAASIEAAITAMAPFVVGRDPWNASAMRADAFSYGLWQFRAQTGNFAWAGIDMALADICGKAVGPAALAPARRRRAQRRHVLLLSRPRRRRRACARRRGAGLAAGYDVFYLKVGLDEKRRPAHGRDAARRARRRAPSCASTPTRAGRCRRRCACSSASPSTTSTSSSSRCARRRSGSSASCAGARRSPSARTRGSGPRRTRTPASARARPTSSASRPRGSARSARSRGSRYVAELEGLAICKHTHGELGHRRGGGPARAADAAERAWTGHQQTAQMMVHDVLTEEMPIATGAHWGLHRQARPRSRGRRGRGCRGGRPLPQRGPVPALAAGLLGREDRP